MTDTRQNDGVLRQNPRPDDVQAAEAAARIHGQAGDSKLSYNAGTDTVNVEAAHLAVDGEDITALMGPGGSGFSVLVENLVIPAGTQTTDSDYTTNIVHEFDLPDLGDFYGVGFLSLELFGDGGEGNEFISLVTSIGLFSPLASAQSTVHLWSVAPHVSDGALVSGAVTGDVFANQPAENPGNAPPLRAAIACEGDVNEDGTTYSDITITRARVGFQPIG